MTGDAIQLDQKALSEIAEKKATCPFIATAVVTGRLPVRNEATNPVASIEDVRRLGNTGGGDLGDLLVLFATGNSFSRWPRNASAGLSMMPDFPNWPFKHALTSQKSARKPLTKSVWDGNPSGSCIGMTSACTRQAAGHLHI